MAYRIGDELVLARAVPETEIPFSVLSRTSSGLVKSVGVDSVARKGSTNLLTSGAGYSLIGQVIETIRSPGSAGDLPRASTTQYGVVKIGDNINVADGLISVPKASNGVYGVVKIGTGIAVVNGVISVTPTSVPETDPAGADTQVQYNAAGVFGASPNFTFTAASGIVTATNYRANTLAGVGVRNVTVDATGLLVAAPLSGGGTPAAPVQSVQYNNAGAFGGTANFTWDIANNRLGIGLAAPAYDLDIRKSSASQVLSAIRNTGDGVVGLYLERTGLSGQDWYLQIPSGATDLKFTATGNDRFWFTAAGKLGIGTTPTFNIDVLTTSSAVARLRTSAVSGVSYILERTGGIAAYWEMRAANGSANLSLYSDADRFFFTPAGFFGIGAIPLVDFDVQQSSAGLVAGRIRNTGTGEARLIIDRTGTTPSRWNISAPSGSTDLTMFTTGLTLFYFQADGRLFATTAYGRKSHHTGHLEGGYSNIGASSTYSSPIYTIGFAYNPNAEDLNPGSTGMYGIGYSYSGAASFLTKFGGSNWGMYVAGNGIAKVFLSGTDGSIQSDSDNGAGQILTQQTQRGSGAVVYNMRRIGGTAADWSMYIAGGDGHLRFYAGGERVLFANNGEVWVHGLGGGGLRMVTVNNNGTLGAQAIPGAGSGTPVGPNRAVQFNNGGVFGGDSGFTYTGPASATATLTSTTTGAAFRTVSTTGDWITGQDIGGSGAANQFYIYDGAAGRYLLTIQKGSTYVGIGPNMVAPETMVHIKGTYAALTLESTGNDLNYILKTPDSLWSIGTNKGGNATAANQFYIYNNLDGGGGGYYFTIQRGTGNIGIGTAAPVYRLDVRGNIRATSTVNANSGTGGRVWMVSGDASSTGYIEWFRPDGSTSIAYMGYLSGGVNNLGLNLFNGAHFNINGGNVGIGTGAAAPSEALHVVGNIYTTSVVTVGAASGRYRRLDFSTGYLEGAQNTVGASHPYTNPIYVIGSNYAPTNSALGNMYGIGFGHSGYGTFLSYFNLSGGGWGLYVAEAGIARIYLDATNAKILLHNGTGGGPLVILDGIYGTVTTGTFYGNLNTGASGLVATTSIAQVTVGDVLNFSAGYSLINVNGRRITSVGTPSAASDATTKQYVDGLFGGGAPSGQYTPAVTLVSNAGGGTTAFQWQYNRVGNTVTLSGQITLQASGAGQVVVDLSLPIASNFTSGREANGTGSNPGGLVVTVLSNTVNDRLTLRWNAAGASTQDFYVIAQYQVQ